MNYYERHLGDYAKDAGHLTALQHGIYSLLMDWYYANERAIPDSMVHRIGRSPREEVEIVLNDFFVRDGDCWTHKRIEQEIVKYRDRADRSRTNGNLGGRPRKTQQVISGFPEETQDKPRPTLLQTPEKQDQEQNLHQKLPPTAERQALDEDPLKLMIDGAIAYMADCQIEHKQARSLIGMLRKAVGDLQSAEILATMQQQRIANPAPWLRNAIQQRGNDPRAGPKSTSKNVAAIHELEGMKHGGRNPQSDFGSLAALPVLGLGRAASG